MSNLAEKLEELFSDIVSEALSESGDLDDKITTAIEDYTEKLTLDADNINGLEEFIDNQLSHREINVSDIDGLEGEIENCVENNLTVDAIGTVLEEVLAGRLNNILTVHIDNVITKALDREPVRVVLEKIVTLAFRDFFSKFISQFLPVVEPVKDITNHVENQKSPD